ncbi:MAG: NADH:ubiquinone reductase (Na(+)-transporting) subunit C [Bacteroidales bacterium]|nr:NADH:ubiquinone reductase (Na(+)-transporting) subunit C [Bacteroidales bacterium]
MDTNKNTYTVIYTIVMVAIVATILALVSMGLKDKQQTNIKVEKQMNILGCAGLAKDAKTVKDRNTYVQDEFKKYITEAMVVNSDGEILKSETENLDVSDAFKVSTADQFDVIRKMEGIQDEAERQKLAKQIQLPVFVCQTPEGGKNYILSGYGAGLWGPIWTYIAVKEDGKIAGALFDHASETPGLGGEIVTDKFRSQFTDKAILENGEIIPITVVKGGAANAANNEINAISGATITSTAVQKMISNWMDLYKPFLQKIVSGAAPAEAVAEAEETIKTE